jgi:predicted phosphodiesterase
MKTDGIFDFKVVEVPFSKYGEQISLYPISDIHYNSPNFARQVWEDFKERVKRDKNQKIFILLGDQMDMLSTSERRHILSGGFHDTTVERWEQDYKHDIKAFLNDALFLKDKTLAVFGGNHFYKFYDGSTSDHAIAHGLNAPYIGCSGYVILVLRYDKHHTHVVKIFCHHGASDAKMKQARANFRCDLLLMGHNHQMLADPKPDIDIVEGKGGCWKIIHHETRMVRTGSFLKSFEPGMKSYPADALMTPAMLGCPKIEITPMRKCWGTAYKGTQSDERWVEIRAVV